jgi:hypothetical protein
MTRPSMNPIERPPSVVIATYERYVDAQRLVDKLSDDGFEVEHVRIIGRGLHSVEQVVGRMTTGKAAAMGAASGAWFGLLIGVLLSLFTTGAWWQPVLTALVLGVVWGAVLGAGGQAATGGRRDFTSTQSMEADTYEVEVSTTHAAQANEIAAKLKLVMGY